jgi:tetratricopeptide (TPR) repeat protein
MKVNKTFYCLIIIIVTTIAYWNSFDVPFQFDDHHAIRDNPGIRDLSDLNRVFNSFPQRPVAQLTFALNYHFHELDVWGYHLVNLIIHIINALLVFWLVLQILNRLKGQKRISLQDPEILFVAFSTGLLFAVHPVQTQAVTYIVQRMASLATLFYLLAVNCFLKGRSLIQKRKFAWIWFVLSGLSGLLGLFTKQIVFTFPIMILMLEWVLYDDIGSFLKKHQKKAIIISVIFLLFLLILPLIYKLDFSNVFKTIPPEQGHTYTLTPYNYFLTQLRVHITYLRLIFLPINQHLDYDYPISESLFEWKVILSGLFLLTLFILAIRYRKKYPVFSIGILWYFIASAVESSIIPIPNVIFEHRLYLPIFGIILIVIIIFYTKLKRILIILIITTAILSYLTHNRNIIWQSENKLWEESYLLSPNKARPNNNYAAITIMDNKILESYLLFKTSLKINPNYSGPLENIYRLFTDIGDINNFSNMDSTNVPIKHLLQYYLNRNMNNEIKTMLREIDIRSINTRNIFYLINVANQLNDVDIYNKLISLSDSLNLLNTDDKIQLKLMNVLKDSSNFTLDDHQLTKIKDPKIKVIYNYNKSRQYALEKKYETAINYIMDALELDNRPEFYHLRAAIFFNVGNYLYAAMDYTSAFKLSGDPEFVKYRAMCYERMGHEESAKNEWRYYKILMEKEGEKGEIPESTFGEGESSPGL